MRDEKTQGRIGEVRRMRVLVAELPERIDGRLEKLGYVGREH
jgi:hypothetical protein